MNLKKVLMELGNQLVTKGYDPAMLPVQRAFCQARSTQAIKEFTEFLNSNPDAIEILEAMGIEWPVVKRN